MTSKQEVMGYSWALTPVCLLLSFFQSTYCSLSSVTVLQPLCHSDERLALLQFKESLIVDKKASAYEFSYPKTDGWKFQGTVDCCSWDGIECDHNTGHVTVVDLGSSCLYGSINSSSSLFRLVHLRKLNLADNDFSTSKIPSGLGNLSMLTYLNLSNSLFSGILPSEISWLSRLTSLDLSYTMEMDFGSLLVQNMIEILDFGSLIQNLTALKHLHLSRVNLTSPVPSSLVNLSSLMSLDLCHCRLLGELPTGIFQLPNLQFLDVSGNMHLTGTLPAATFSSSRLKLLSIGFTNFSGVLPASIGSLHSLEFLDVTACRFRGVLPSSLGNLTKLKGLALLNNSFTGDIPSSLSNLTQMLFLSLGMNKFNLNTIPSWFFSFNQLNELHLPFCRIKGPIPSFFANLTQLAVLDLNHNQFTGPFLAGITNLTQLKQLSLGSNMLNGALPNSIFMLEKLELLEIYSNRLSGIVELDQFLRLEHLTILYLSSNNLTLISHASPNTSHPMLNELGLGSCNLRQFPNFLREQNQLAYLDLSYNNIHGHIPKWILEMSTETLFLLDLSFNSLIGFHESPTVLPWSNILMLDLSCNLFQGSLPIPSISVMVYLASNNTFTGEIPQEFCNMTSLQILDLSRNKLVGIIPPCLSNVSKSLSVLNLHVNNFHGSIPQAWIRGNKLKMINLGQNSLQGKLPRSLAMCRMLQFLDIGNNQIRDAFPFWLESLPELKILILRSNKFYGEIKSTEFDSVFPKLRVIDLSNNEFMGPLPSSYLERWKAITSFHVEHLSYMQADLYDHMFMAGLTIPDEYNYSMTLTNKGIKMEYQKILEVFMAIDLSCNKFRGEIPESVGNLKGLQLLNLSNNILVGQIPSVIGNLTKLEALDLSQNKLGGEIPWQLKQLNFLEVFNVSHNNLSGPIPTGKQFDTFPNSSFVGNPELCGNPLWKKCEDQASPPAPSEENQGSRSLEWKGVLLGFGTGFSIGMGFGCIVVARHLKWFARTFRIRLGSRRK